MENNNPSPEASQSNLNPNPAPLTPSVPQAGHDDSETTRTVVTVLLLFLFMPVGIIVMWFWPKWKTWVKILITLLPLLLILPILAAIALISVNPARQFGQSNDTQRKLDVNTILSAIDQAYAASNTLPATLKNAQSNQPIPLSSTSPFAGTALCQALVPTYITELPKDPQVGAFNSCASFDTGYTITILSNSPGSLPQITVSAPHAQGGTPISVTR